MDANGNPKKPMRLEASKATLGRITIRSFRKIQLSDDKAVSLDRQKNAPISEGEIEA